MFSCFSQGTVLVFARLFDDFSVRVDHGSGNVAYLCLNVLNVGVSTDVSYIQDLGVNWAQEAGNEALSIARAQNP